MNLDRIDIRVLPDALFMALAKISDFSKLYTFISLNNVISEQKINTGDKIEAFNFKNIEQFKGLRPFYAVKEDTVIESFKLSGTEKSYKTKLKKGDLVKYNGIKYIVLGMVVNTYAQWNLPTPLLLNPTNINNDFKSLFSGRFTDVQVNNKINDNFQAGKYDADMLIPLVDANDFKDSIQIIEPAYSQEEAKLIVDSVSAEKNLSVSAEKDVFINTMLKLRGNEINEIKETNQDLFKSMQDLLLSVNKAVNEQIELAPKEKPAKKTRAKKVVEVTEPIVEDESEDLPDFIRKSELIINLPEPIQKLVLFRNKEEGDITDVSGTISQMLSWGRTSEGFDFWELIHNEGDLREFKRIYGDKGEYVDRVIDGLVSFNELLEQADKKVVPAKNPEVKGVTMILYPPDGGVLEILTNSLYELFDTCQFVMKKLNVSYFRFNLGVEIDGSTNTSKIEFTDSTDMDGFMSLLVQKYLIFGEFNWYKFDQAEADLDKIDLNQEIINDAWKKDEVEEKPKSKPEPKTKPVKVVAPKVVKPKPEPKVAKSKPAPKEKIVKQEKKSDLSFLDDLDNIF